MDNHSGKFFESSSLRRHVNQLILDTLKALFLVPENLSPEEGNFAVYEVAYFFKCFLQD